MFETNNETQITGDNNLVIQDIQGSTVTINLNNPKELRDFMIKFQNELIKLPLNILEKLKEHQQLEIPPTVGANLYLTVLVMVPLGGSFSIIGKKLSVTVTNLTKEIRYFNKPYFKSHPQLPIQTEQFDSFILLDQENYPFRLEYGEVKSLQYELKPKLIEDFSRISTADGYIEAFINTTVGELYSSNRMKMSQLFQ